MNLAMLLRQTIVAAMLVALAAPVVSVDAQQASAPDESSVVLRHAVETAQPYRLVATNDQTIRVNGAVARVAQIVTRAAITPLEIGESSARSFAARFELSESDRRAGNAVGVARSYQSRFTRDERGYQHVSEGAIMPVQRDLPVFPSAPLRPGDGWTEDAGELHDLSAAFGFEQPVAFRFPVSYRYLGVELSGRRPTHLIEARYNIFHRVRQQPSNPGPYPVLITGESRRTIAWDLEAGRIASEREVYTIVFTLSDGTIIEYSGTAQTEALEADAVDLEPLRRSLTQDDSEAMDTRVEQTERGVSIVLERIEFDPDSSRLRPEAIARLERIAAALAAYPNNDVLITGHTALAGTARGRRELSLQRARVVSDVLLQQTGRDPRSIYYTGSGADQPIASNATEAGRSRNRRVEITILNN